MRSNRASLAALQSMLRLGMALTLFLVYIGTAGSIDTYASTELARNMRVSIDGSEGHNVKVIDISYENNAYVSLRDMAAILSDTSKKYDISVTSAEVNITTGMAYDGPGGENSDWGPEGKTLKGHSLKNNLLKKDDTELKYFIMVVGYDNGVADAYMTLNDLAMMLDMNVKTVSAGEAKVFTNESFVIDPAELEKYGYFESVNAVLVGDATTGDIYYTYNATIPYPIASTTKLMTLAIVEDELSKGNITLDDIVTISPKVSALSKGEDGVVNYEPGMQVTVKDLMYAAMLPSSNESALALAEFVSGDEEAFVGRMMDEAKELGMTTAIFHNPHGLPNFVGSDVPSKIHNRVSAEDMFKLCTYLLNQYPEVKDITSTKVYNMTSRKNLEIKNTNPLLHNMKEVTGLKTGTTNRAGACLMTSLHVSKQDGDHDLVVVMLGAETGQDRGRVSEVLARYAIRALQGEAMIYGGDLSVIDDVEEPKSAEGIVSKVLEYVRNLV